MSIKLELWKSSLERDGNRSLNEVSCFSSIRIFIDKQWHRQMLWGTFTLFRSKPQTNWSQLFFYAFIFKCHVLYNKKYFFFMQISAFLKVEFSLNGKGILSVFIFLRETVTRHISETVWHMIMIFGTLV